MVEIMATEPHDRLLFYVDPAWQKLPGPYSLLLYPFWGDQSSASSPFRKMALESYPLDMMQYGITADLDAADAVLMPFSDEIAARYHPTLLAECQELSRTSGLHLVIDGMGHLETPFRLPNASIIRYGGYRFETGPSEIHVTPFADDLLERYKGGTLTVRPKQDRPSISFVGWAHLTPSLRAKSIIKELPDRLHGFIDSRYRTKKKGLFFRERALRALNASPLVDAKTIARPTYSGSIKTVVGDIETARREFVDTMFDCDYGLEVRGNSNVSTRLSEITGLGRIPVIIDTQRNLPFGDELDYCDFSLVVDFRTLDKLPRILHDFHANLSDAQFAQMQRNARDAYVSHMRPDAVMSYVVRRIRQNMDRLGSTRRIAR